MSLINTNMSMQGSDFMANVVATDFELRNKSKMFAIKGKGGISYTGETDKGFFKKVVQKVARKISYLSKA